MKRYRYSASVLMAGILWGIIGLFVRQLGSTGMNSVQIALVRAMFSMLILFAGLLLFRRSLLRIRLRDLWCFLGTGMMSLTLFNLCYFYTMTLTSLSVASVLLYTAPAFVTVMSALLFRERLTPLRVACLILALIGCALVTGVFFDSVSVCSLGILTGVGSGFGYALYSIFGRYALLRGYHTLTINFWTFLVATVSLLPFAGIAQTAEQIVRGSFPWGIVLLLAAVSTVLPYLLYTYGLTGLDGGRASVLATVEPVVATLTGWIVFDETLGFGNVCGMIFVLVAVILLNLPIGGIHKYKNKHTEDQS